MLLTMQWDVPYILAEGRTFENRIS